MRSVSLNHLPQDNKNHTLFIHTTISREGGGVLNVTGPSIQLIYTPCQSNSSKFSLVDIFNIAYSDISDNAGHTKIGVD